MNTTTIAPEVQEFLAAVRKQLADLDPEEQREILDGLEADLTDLVAERGGEALGDPVAYARELRTAAGLDEVTVRHTRPIRASVDGFLDACHARFDTLVGRLPWDASPLLAWLRPLWWVVRAWLAVQLVDMVGSGSGAAREIFPHMRGLGWFVLVVAVLVSVQLGRGRFWPGGNRGVLARLVLVALNAGAIVGAFAVVDGLGQDRRFWDGYGQGYDEAQMQMQGSYDGSTPIDEQAGVYADGKWVSNIYPYDAQGRPLVGVQLFNQIGQPINVVTQPEYPNETCTLEDENGTCLDPGSDAVVDDFGNPLPKVFYPWTNGATQLFNVFPIPSRVQESDEPSPTAFAEKDPPAIGVFPLASVPKVSLPGIKVSEQRN